MLGTSKVCEKEGWNYKTTGLFLYGKLKVDGDIGALRLEVKG
jgi:hypothetical protein